MVNIRGTLEEFIEDIEPFFYGKRITYVDIGAFKGEIFKALLNSKVNIREAHLFEPNPKSYQYLLTELSDKKNTHIHNLAIGCDNKKLTFKSNESMTKILNDNSQVLSDNFTVSFTTLDKFIKSVTGEHISILKIDVEGFEKEVLEGAFEILSSQSIDLIYIEVGMNQNNNQQTYYRIVDDILNSKNYRVFRMYEQMFEWIDDSPFLRRVNFAYMSENFAQNNPFRLSNEIFALSKQKEEIKKHLKEKVVQVEFLEKEKNELFNKSENLEKVIKELQLNLTESQENKEILDIENAQLNQKLTNLIIEKESLIQNLEDVKEERDTTTQERDELLNRLEDLEKVLEELQLKLSESQESSKTLGKEKTELMQQLNKIIIEKDSLIQNLKDCREESNRCILENKRLENIIFTIQTEFEKVKEQELSLIKHQKELKNIISKAMMSKQLSYRFGNVILNNYKYLNFLKIPFLLLIELVSFRRDRNNKYLKPLNNFINETVKSDMQKHKSYIIGFKLVNVFKKKS